MHKTAPEILSESLFRFDTTEHSKETWRKITFGEAVRCVNESETNPQEKGLERVVGLEHIDPEDLRIKRWASIEESTSFTRVFRAGQVLFGKRRAYQRKVALADFDGICSGDILVFEARPDVLLPELLPFLVQSEGFFQHALDTSAGSLSPRTKWSDLAKYELLLPPIDEQLPIAELMWAVENTIRAHYKVLAHLEDVRESLLREVSLMNHVQHKDLGELLIKAQYGTSVAPKNSGDYIIFRMNNIVRGYMDESDLKYVTLSKEEYEAFRLEKGDMLFNRTNSAELVGKVGIYQLDGNHVFASYLVRLRANREIILPDFLNYYMNSAPAQNAISNFATKGVSQSNINVPNLKRLKIPVPSLTDQARIVSRIKQIESGLIACELHITGCRRMKKHLFSTFTKVELHV